MQKRTLGTIFTRTTPKAKGWKTLKENQGENGLCKHREANPSRGENLKSNPGPPGWGLDIGLAT
jgi:hypothetical protein